MNSAPKPSPTIATLTFSAIWTSEPSSPAAAAAAALRRADVENAVHDSPVPGERADVRILPLLRRCPELHGQRLTWLDQLGREQHLRNLRNVLLRRTVRGPGELVGGSADRVQRVLLPD